MPMRLSRMTKEEPEWEPGKKEQVTGQCPEPQDIEEALKRVRERCAMVDAITETIDDKNVEGVAITWTRTNSDIERLQQEEDAINRILYWAPTESESGCSPLGPNLIPKEPAIQHGPEVVAYWSQWSEIVLKNRVLYRKWFQPEKKTDRKINFIRKFLENHKKSMTRFGFSQNIKLIQKNSFFRGRDRTLSLRELRKLITKLVNLKGLINGVSSTTISSNRSWKRNRKRASRATPFCLTNF